MTENIDISQLARHALFAVVGAVAIVIAFSLGFFILHELDRAVYGGTGEGYLSDAVMILANIEPIVVSIITLLLVLVLVVGTVMLVLHLYSRARQI